MTSMSRWSRTSVIWSDIDRSVDFYDLLLREEPILRNVWDFGYVARIAGYPGVKLGTAFVAAARRPHDSRAARVPRARTRAG